MPDHFIAIRAAVAHSIPADHWLNSPDFAWFARGYGYAQSQTMTIPALAAVEPGHTFHAFTAILRGALLGCSEAERREVIAKMLEAAGVAP